MTNNREEYLQGNLMATRKTNCDLKDGGKTDAGHWVALGTPQPIKFHSRQSLELFWMQGCCFPGFSKFFAHCWTVCKSPYHCLPQAPVSAMDADATPNAEAAHEGLATPLAPEEGLPHPLRQRRMPHSWVCIQESAMPS